MKRKMLWIAVGLVLAFAAGFELAARMTNPAGGVIPRDVVAGGGGRSTSTGGNVLNSTIGQPATAISMASNGTVLVGGFQTMVPMATSTAARRWSLY
jgi:hypothetical protein